MKRSLMLNTESYVELDGDHFFRLDKSYADIHGGAIEMDFTIDSTVTSDTTMFLISSRTSSNVSDDRSFLINNGKFRNDIRGSRVLTTNTESIETGVRYRVYQIDNNCHVWDKASNEIIWGMRSTPSTNNNSYNTNPFLVGASYNSDSQIDTRRMIGKIYSLKIYDGGELIRHYVPYASDAMRDIVSGNIIYLQTSYTYQVKYNYVGGKVYANDELVGTITDIDTPITFQHTEPSVYVTCEGVPETKEEVLSTSTSTTYGDATYYNATVIFKQTNQIGAMYDTEFVYQFRITNYSSADQVQIERKVYKTLDQRIRRTRYTVPYGEDITPNEVVSFEYVEKSNIYIDSTPQGSNIEMVYGTDNTPVTINAVFYTSVPGTDGQNYTSIHNVNISTTLGELIYGGYNSSLVVTIPVPTASGKIFDLQSGTATIYNYSKNIA